MTRSPALPRTLALIAPLCAIAGGLAAQESTALPGTADACRAIASDAARLACYDAVYGRDADHTRDADQQARAANAHHLGGGEVVAVAQTLDLAPRLPRVGGPGG